MHQNLKKLLLMQQFTYMNLYIIIYYFLLYEYFKQCFIQIEHFRYKNLEINEFYFLKYLHIKQSLFLEFHVFYIIIRNIVNIVNCIYRSY